MNKPTNADIVIKARDYLKELKESNKTEDKVAYSKITNNDESILDFLETVTEVNPSLSEEEQITLINKKLADSIIPVK